MTVTELITILQQLEQDGLGSSEVHTCTDLVEKVEMELYSPPFQVKPYYFVILK